MEEATVQTVSELGEEAAPYIAPDGPAEKEWSAVRAALAREEWDFRTVEGIARDTAIPAGRVMEILDEHPDEVRRSMVPDRKGRILYTLRSRPVGFREMLATARAFVAKST